MSAPKKNTLHKSDIAVARVLGTLGEGAFGVVQLVKTADGKYLAHKECTINEMRNERKDILQEICLQTALNKCEFIVTNYGYNETKEKIYIFLDLGAIDMRCLFNVRSHAPESKDDDENKQETTTPTELTEFIIYCILKALKYMHRKKISHRDVKCENVLLFGDGSVKLSDLGLSKYDANDLKTICGTDGFMAPEVLSRPTYTVKTDLWSLGVTIMECANATAFYAIRETLDEEDVKTFYKDLKKLSKNNIIMNKLNKRLKDVLHSVLRTKPSNRMSAKDILAKYFYNYITGATLIKTDLQYVGKRVVTERIERIENSKKDIKGLVGNKGRDLCECGAAWLKTKATALRAQNDAYGDGAVCDSCDEEIEMERSLYHCGNLSFHGDTFDFCKQCVKKRNGKLAKLKY